MIPFTSTAWLLNVRFSSFKFLGTHISENLSWTTNTSSLIKKAHQRLFFLGILKNHLSTAILGNFYRKLLSLSSSHTGQIFRQDEVWMSSVWVQNQRSVGDHLLHLVPDVEGQVAQVFGLVYQST
ncbi:hypothetical protein L3Q82_007434 [Scortum barcoo]|uniref:Uncharacterized protein n=1 Tax=Scortum barcoo TaxID=214431 RepID=A0ACB8WN02_9TELE|nr:hypothetical protein L3Q82_007434 [Scortum barcoo]